MMKRNTVMLYLAVYATMLFAIPVAADPLPVPDDKIGIGHQLGYEVSTQSLNIRFKDWWHLGKGLIQTRNFWAGMPLTKKQNILKVADEEYRTDSILGLSIEESEAILGRLRKGNYSVGGGVRKVGLKQVDWSKLQFLRKRGDIVSIESLHKGGRVSRIFELEMTMSGEDLVIQQVLQAVP